MSLFSSLLFFSKYHFPLVYPLPFLFMVGSALFGLLLLFFPLCSSLAINSSTSLPSNFTSCSPPFFPSHSSFYLCISFMSLLLLPPLFPSSFSSLFVRLFLVLHFFLLILLLLCFLVIPPLSSLVRLLLIFCLSLSFLPSFLYFFIIPSHATYKLWEKTRLILPIGLFFALLENRGLEFNDQTDWISSASIFISIIMRIMIKYHILTVKWRNLCPPWFCLSLDFLDSNRPQNCEYCSALFEKWHLFRAQGDSQPHHQHHPLHLTWIIWGVGPVQTLAL